MSDFRNMIKAVIHAEIADKTEQLITRDGHPLEELRSLQSAILTYRNCLDLIDQAWRSIGNME